VNALPGTNDIAGRDTSDQPLGAKSGLSASTTANERQVSETVTHTRETKMSEMEVGCNRRARLAGTIAAWRPSADEVLQSPGRCEITLVQGIAIAGGHRGANRSQVRNG
jgi:hypothetical protein